MLAVDAVSPNKPADSGFDVVVDNPHPAAIKSAYLAKPAIVATSPPVTPTKTGSSNNVFMNTLSRIRSSSALSSPRSVRFSTKERASNRAKNRWHLAVLLIANPSLRKVC